MTDPSDDRELELARLEGALPADQHRPGMFGVTETRIHQICKKGGR